MLFASYYCKVTRESDVGTGVCFGIDKNEFVSRIITRGIGELVGGIRSDL